MTTLDEASHVPISQLTPLLPAPNSRAVKAIVTLTWPFSSATGSAAFLLAEPDFRLRRTRGQVRIHFSGPSARAIVKHGVASGDMVVVSLDGAQWVEETDVGSTPGRGIEVGLKFTERLLLKFRPEGAGDFTLIDIDHPPPEPESDPLTTIPIPSPEPMESTQVISTLDTTSKQVKVVQYGDEWSSPAFRKRTRTSYGSLFDSDYDPFAEADGTISGRGRKRTRLSTTWRYSSRSPSPEIDQDESTPVTSDSSHSAVKLIPRIADEASQTVDLELVGPDETLAQPIKVLSPNDPRGPVVGYPLSVDRTSTIEQPSHMTQHAMIQNDEVDKQRGNSQLIYRPNTDVLGETVVSLQNQAPIDHSVAMLPTQPAIGDLHDNMHNTRSLHHRLEGTTTKGNEQPEAFPFYAASQEHVNEFFTPQTGRCKGNSMVSKQAIEPAKSAVDDSHDMGSQKQEATYSGQGLEQAQNQVEVDDDHDDISEPLIPIEQRVLYPELDRDEMPDHSHAIHYPLIAKIQDRSTHTSKGFNNIGGFTSLNSSAHRDYITLRPTTQFAGAIGNDTNQGAANARGSLQSTVAESDDYEYDHIDHDDASIDEYASDEEYSNDDDVNENNSLHHIEPREDSEDENRLDERSRSSYTDNDVEYDLEMDNDTEQEDEEAQHRTILHEALPPRTRATTEPEVIDLISSDDENETIQPVSSAPAASIAQLEDVQSSPHGEEWGGISEDAEELNDAQDDVTDHMSSSGKSEMHNESPVLADDGSDKEGVIPVDVAVEDESDFEEPSPTNIGVQYVSEHNRTSPVDVAVEDRSEHERMSPVDVADDDESDYEVLSQISIPIENRTEHEGLSQTDAASEDGSEVEGISPVDAALDDESDVEIISLNVAIEERSALEKITPKDAAAKDGSKDQRLTPEDTAGEDAVARYDGLAEEVPPLYDPSLVLELTVAPHANPDGHNGIQSVQYMQSSSSNNSPNLGITEQDDGSFSTRNIEVNSHREMTTTDSSQEPGQDSAICQLSRSEISKFDGANDERDTAAIDPLSQLFGQSSETVAHAELPKAQTTKQSSMQAEMLVHRQLFTPRGIHASPDFSGTEQVAEQERPQHMSLESCSHGSDKHHTGGHRGSHEAHELVIVDDVRTSHKVRVETLEITRETERLVVEDKYREREEIVVRASTLSPEGQEAMIEDKLNDRPQTTGSAENDTPFKQTTHYTISTPMKRAEQVPRRMVPVVEVPIITQPIAENDLQDESIQTQLEHQLHSEQNRENQLAPSDSRESTASHAVKHDEVRDGRLETTEQLVSPPPRRVRPATRSHKPAAEPRGIHSTPEEKVTKTNSQEHSHRSPSLITDMPQTPDGHDASIELAESDIGSPIKFEHDLTRPPTDDAKIRLYRTLRDELRDYTAVKSIRYYLHQKVDVIAIAKTSPPEPKRAKTGPRQYTISFKITDHTTAPAHVLEVQIFRPYKEALPVIKAGDGVLLRSFQVTSIKGKGFGLRSHQHQACGWAIFNPNSHHADIRGPPVEYGKAEQRYIVDLIQWYRDLDAVARLKLARASEK